MSDDLKYKPVSDSIKERFEKLKERRLKIELKAKHKQEKKDLKKKAQKSLEENNLVKTIEPQILNNTLLINEIDNIKIEKQIDSAIKDGNFELAEELSDKLSEYDSKIKLQREKEAKEFLDSKKLTVSRKKSIQWTFETKKRWETKANM